MSDTRGERSVRPAVNLRSRLERGVLEVVRCYTRYTPLRRGKYRLMMMVSGLTRSLPREMIVETVDGCRLQIDWSTGMVETIFFFGEYERANSSIVRHIVRPGDVCLDVGANMGWYTTLLRTLCGASGEVHAFEPVPDTFARLQRNVELAGDPDNVVLNRLALGDTTGPVELFVFDGLPDGHASLAEMSGFDSTTVSSQAGTVDHYLGSRDLAGVAFVKLDIEGSELDFLRGGEGLLQRDPAPIFLIEMAAATARAFGYSPNDLLDYLSARAAFEFFAIDEVSGRLLPLHRFPPGSPGAYVLCVPQGAPRERIRGLL